jgi:hypothetical protein
MLYSQYDLQFSMGETRGGEPKLVSGPHWEKIAENINFLDQILAKAMVKITDF